jgi:hypothetical protein
MHNLKLSHRYFSSVASLPCPKKIQINLVKFYSSSSSSSENEDVNSESSVESADGQAIPLPLPIREEIVYNPMLAPRRALLAAFYIDTGIDPITASRRAAATIINRPNANAEGPLQAARRALQQHEHERVLQRERELSENNISTVVDSSTNNNASNSDNDSSSNSPDNNFSNLDISNPTRNFENNSSDIGISDTTSNNSENNSSNNESRSQTPTEYVAELERETPMDIIPMDD